MENETTNQTVPFQHPLLPRPPGAPRKSTSAYSLSTSDRLPIRLNEHSFRKYEPYIKQIVEQYPTVVQIPTEAINLPLDLWAQRCRDAMKSLAVYGWSTDIDVEKCRECLIDVKFRRDPQTKTIFVGPKYDLREAQFVATKPTFNAPVGKTPSTYAIEVNITKLEDLEAFINYALSGIFVGSVPIRVLDCVFDQETINSLYQKYDIGAVLDEKKNLLISY